MQCLYGDCENEALIGECYCAECNEKLDDFEADKVAQGIEDGFFEQEGSIYCPYCGTVIDDPDNEFNDEMQNFTCTDCGQDFILHTETIQIYSTRKWEDDND